MTLVASGIAGSPSPAPADKVPQTLPTILSGGGSFGSLTGG